MRWPADTIHLWLGAPGPAEVLSAYLGAEPVIALGPHGKPHAPGTGLHFNLSHSGDLRVLAVARREVGLDIELIRDRGDVGELAAIGLPETQAQQVAAAPEHERNELFHKLWARHEARCKLHGVGLVAPLPGIPDRVVDLDLGPGVAAALALYASARDSAAWPPPITALQWESSTCSTGSSSSGWSAPRRSSTVTPVM
jgi:hypothetical protein